MMRILARQNKKGHLGAYSLVDALIAILVLAIGIVGALQTMQSLQRIHQKVDNHVKELETYYRLDSWKEYS